MWLVPPVVEEQTDGTYLVTRQGVGVSPVDDPAYLTCPWELDGNPTGQQGLRYTKADPSEDYRLIELVATLKNRTMNAAGRSAVTRVLAQPASVVTLTPLVFKKAENDRVTHKNVAADTSNLNTMFFARVKPEPDVGETNFTGRIARFGPYEIRFTSSSALQLDLRLQTHDAAGNGAGTSFPPLTPVAKDDILDVAIIYGLPFNRNDQRPSARFAVWKNGVPVQFTDGQATVTELARLAGPNVMFKPADLMVQGGLNESSPNIGAVTHSVDRITLFGQVDAAKLPTSTEALRAQFVDANGNLQHPQAAIAKFGSALIDFYNIDGPNGTPTNHGTLGAPLSMSDLK